jgi:hypothetical protein
MGAVVVNSPVRRPKTALDIGPSVFLAGSIEMGGAEDWQVLAIAALSDAASVIYNPRRPDWDPAWSVSAAPEFRRQVDWELDMLDHADLIAIYFDPTTQAPVTLLELGLMARTKPDRIHLSCPEGFWRKANVDAVCRREGIRTYPDLAEMLAGLRMACAGV